MGSFVNTALETCLAKEGANSDILTLRDNEPVGYFAVPPRLACCASSVARLLALVGGDRVLRSSPAKAYCQLVGRCHVTMHGGSFSSG